MLDIFIQSILLKKNIENNNENNVKIIIKKKYIKIIQRNIEKINSLELL